MNTLPAHDFLNANWMPSKSARTQARSGSVSPAPPLKISASYPSVSIGASDFSAERPPVS